MRLWLHECERVFRDRLVSDADAAKFDEFHAAVAKKYFDDAPGGAAALEERPLLFTSFMQQVGGGEVLIVSPSLQRAPRRAAQFTLRPCLAPSSPSPAQTASVQVSPQPYPPHPCHHPLQSGEEPVYAAVPSYDALRKVLDDRLAEYNETNTVREGLGLLGW